MSILTSIGRIAADFNSARARHRTERAIRALPLELQKDIGWPEATGTRIKSDYGAGSWAGTN